jgi:hypothetical protein
MRVVVLLLAILALAAFIGCQAKPMVLSESGSESEGIKVHGDWTVEVTNPDGSLATRKQFANAFKGQHLVAGFLSYDLEVDRTIDFFVSDSPSGGLVSSDEANCKESILKTDFVLATAIHAPNDDGDLYNSVWSASCTLEINGDQPKFLTKVETIMLVTPKIGKKSAGGFVHGVWSLSSKELAEPIEVLDGQVIAATVILSVE